MSAHRAWPGPPGRPTAPLELGFAAFWRTTATPSARLACTVVNAVGEATAHASGSLRGGQPFPSS